VHRDLFRAVQAGQKDEVQRLTAAMNDVLAQYNCPTLGETLAKLKARMAGKGLCEPYVLPPLRR